MLDKTEEVVPCVHELNQNQKLWVGKLCRCILCGAYVYAAKENGKVNMSKKERLRERKREAELAKNEKIVYGRTLSTHERESMKKRVAELAEEAQK
jgi:hypothetical protein